MDPSLVIADLKPIIFLDRFIKQISSAFTDIISLSLKNYRIVFFNKVVLTLIYDLAKFRNAYDCLQIVVNDESVFCTGAYDFINFKEKLNLS